MAIPLDLQRALQLKPLGISDGVSRVAALYPLTAQELAALSSAEAGLPVEEHVLDRAEVLQHLRSISGSIFTADATGDFASGFSASLLEAIELGASDLHIRLLNNGEPCHLRRRIHGYLHEAQLMDPAIARRFITWAKQKAGLDSSEHMQPQEGRFALLTGGVTVEFRVSCAGQTDGETMVIACSTRGAG